MPQLSVPGAIRETGMLTIRRGRALEFRTLNVDKAKRTDLRSAASLGIPARAVTDSPLGTRAYQSYEFVTVPYSIDLEATERQASVKGTSQTLLRVTAREQTLESRIALDVTDGPLFALRISLPAGLELDRVTTSGRYEWSVADPGETPAGVARVLTVYSPSRRTGYRGHLAPPRFPAIQVPASRRPPPTSDYAAPRRPPRDAPSSTGSKTQMTVTSPSPSSTMTLRVPLSTQ